MHKLIRTTLLLGLCVTLFAAIAEAKLHREELVPKGLAPVNFKSEKSTHIYYPINSAGMINLAVSGPCSLKVFTRAIFPSSKKSVVKYDLVVAKDGKPADTLTYKSGKSLTTIEGHDNFIVSDSKVDSYLLGAGGHTFSFTLAADTKPEVYVRFESVRELKKKPEAKPKFSIEQTKGLDNLVGVLVKAKEYNYHRCSKNQPLTLDAIGPLDLKVISRLEFDQTMHGEKPYVVQIFEDGNLLQSSPFTAKVSGKATYAKISDKVLGRPGTLEIHIPEGKHKLLITTPDSGVEMLVNLSHKKAPSAAKD